MPQAKRSLALMYAVNPFGSDHESSDHDATYEEDSYKAFEDRYASLGLTTTSWWHWTQKSKSNSKLHSLFRVLGSLQSFQASSPGRP